MIESFAKGNAWEEALKLSKELAKHYEEELGDYAQLSKLLKQRAELLDSVIAGTRDEPQVWVSTPRARFSSRPATSPRCAPVVFSRWLLGPLFSSQHPEQGVYLPGPIQEGPHHHFLRTYPGGHIAPPPPSVMPGAEPRAALTCSVFPRCRCAAAISKGAAANVSQAHHGGDAQRRFLRAHRYLANG